jgi:hypothetical protein
MGIEFVIGTHTKLELVSASHGAIRVPLAQTFDYTPSFDEKRIFEFDNADMVAVVTNFNGVEVRFDHFDSDSKLVDAMVNDLDPAAVATVDDPSLYKNVTVMVNVRKKSDNTIFQSVLCKNVALTGAAQSEPVRDEATMARSGISTNVLRLKGVALEYTRALRAASTAFAQTKTNSQEDVVATPNVGTGPVVSYSWDVTNTPQVVQAADPLLSGSALIFVMKNGSEYLGATLTGSTISVPAADFGANDIFEAFTSYIDA